MDNAGVLTASGLIAGEALCGLVIAALVGSGTNVTLMNWTAPFIMALIALAVLVLVMIQVPLRNAGRPDEPAPPTRRLCREHAFRYFRSAARVSTSVVASDSRGKLVTMGSISHPSPAGIPRVSEIAWHSTYTPPSRS